MSNRPVVNDRIAERDLNGRLLDNPCPSSGDADAGRAIQPRGGDQNHSAVSAPAPAPSTASSSTASTPVRTAAGWRRAPAAANLHQWQQPDANIVVRTRPAGETARDAADSTTKARENEPQGYQSEEPAATGRSPCTSPRLTARRGVMNRGEGAERPGPPERGRHVPRQHQVAAASPMFTGRSGLSFAPGIVRTQPAVAPATAAPARSGGKAARSRGRRRASRRRGVTRPLGIGRSGAQPIDLEVEDVVEHDAPGVSTSLQRAATEERAAPRARRWRSRRARRQAPSRRSAGAAVPDRRARQRLLIS